MQLKGGFSFQLNKNLKAKRDIWQPSFVDRRVRDSLEYAKFKDYIWQNHSTINETGLPDISLGFQIFVQLKREAAF
jgi:hypothetical protein